MAEEKKSNFFEIIDAHKQLIKFNQDKVPKHFLCDYYFEDTIENLNKNAYKDDIFTMKYYSLLNTVGDFINRYDTDFSCIKKSTINKINEESRLHALNKVVFSEPEDETDLIMKQIMIMMIKQMMMEIMMEMTKQKMTIKQRIKLIIMAITMKIMKKIIKQKK